MRNSGLYIGSDHPKYHCGQSKYNQPYLQRPPASKFLSVCSTVPPCRRAAPDIEWLDHGGGFHENRIFQLSEFLSCLQKSLWHFSQRIPPASNPITLVKKAEVTLRFWWDTSGIGMHPFFVFPAVSPDTAVFLLSKRRFLYGKRKQNPYSVCSAGQVSGGTLCCQ